MRELRVWLPERLAAELEALVRDGWFLSEEEIARLALAEFVRRHEFELQDEFQLEDIAWALKEREGRE